MVAAVIVQIAAIATVAIPSPTFVSGVFVVSLGTIAVFVHAHRRTRAETGGARLTLATTITAVRSSAVVVLAGFATTGAADGSMAWLPALLFGGAALFDAVDGLVARRRNEVTSFGSRVDVETDALALLVGVAVAVRIGAVPLVFLGIGLARYVFLAGIFWRRHTDKPVRELPPSQIRRALGASMMGVVFLTLTPLFDPAVTHLLASVAMGPFLLWFLRDWLVVSTRL